jgi:hypothetical protein
MIEVAPRVLAGWIGNPWREVRLPSLQENLQSAGVLLHYSG